MSKSNKTTVDPQVMAVLPESLKIFLSHGKTKLETDADEWTVEVENVPNFLQNDLSKNSVIIANNGCGDRLFLVSNPNSPGQFDSKVYVHWHEGPCIEVLADEISTLLMPAPPSVTQRGPVFYYGSQTMVEPGDEVMTRVFFFRRPGRVVYVPGKSRKNREMEHHVLCWVGIQLENGVRQVTIVDPKSSCLKKSVCFVKRSSGPFEEIKPEERFE